MRTNGLRSACKRKLVHTTDSHQDLPIAENVLNRQFEPETVNKAWVADVTSIRTRGYWDTQSTITTIDTRRFSVRPAAVSLKATGWRLPRPRVSMFSCFMPVCANTVATLLARRTESCWL